MKVAALVLCLLSVTSCYTLKQAYYQGNLLRKRTRIENLLWRQDTPVELKDKLRLVQLIVTYASVNGLNSSGAYVDYLESPHKEGVSFIVQAAPADALKFKTWSFPIIGDVPYLGFYHQEDRDQLSQELRSQGLDVAEGEAEAFSSLGWFNDPIFSSMLERGKASLAHLLFHELTHRTLWISGHSDFNENLAEFVAFKLTQRFLIEEKELLLLEKYKTRFQDKILFAAWLGALKAELTTIYESPGLSTGEKLNRKKTSITSYKTTRCPKFASEHYSEVCQREWNNASILGALMYNPDMRPFEKGFACASWENIGAFLESIERSHSSGKSPLEALIDSCTNR